MRKLFDQMNLRQTSAHPKSDRIKTVEENKMDASYVLLAIAIVIPIVVFALMPYLATWVRRLEFHPRVSVDCYRCLEPYVQDCSAVCSIPV